MTHLNYFEPYRRSGHERHEDDLTRAFLVLLRMVPMIQAEFLERLRARQPDVGYGDEQLLPRLSETDEEVKFETQTTQLDSEREWLVSVLMTDEPISLEDELAPREQGARYDGVLTLDDHVVTIETKPHNEDVWRKQLDPDLPEEGQLGFPPGARPLVLPWKEMIQAITNLRDRDRLDPTSAMLVDDFLNYVFRHFEFLNPYPTFAACRDSRLLMNRRCGQVLRELGGEERVGEYTSDRFYLKMLGSQVPARRTILDTGHSDASAVTHVRAATYPGDLVSQARPFYRRLDREALLGLVKQDAWRTVPNLHLSYRGDHLIYATAEFDLASYLDYWIENGDRIRRVQGMEEMNEEVHRLREDGWLAERDIEAFEEKFGQTKRDFMEICPGVRVETLWSIDEARELDDGEGRFVKAVRERFERMLGLWGQSLLEPEMP